MNTACELPILAHQDSTRLNIESILCVYQWDLHGFKVHEHLPTFTPPHLAHMEKRESRWVPAASHISITLVGTSKVPLPSLGMHTLLHFCFSVRERFLPSNTLGYSSEFLAVRGGTGAGAGDRSLFVTLGAGVTGPGVWDRDLTEAAGERAPDAFGPSLVS